MISSKNFFLIAFFFYSSSFAGKLLLKNGTTIIIPDEVTLNNDSGSKIIIHKYSKAYHPKLWAKFEVEKDKNIKIRINNEESVLEQKNFFRIFVDNKIHSFIYPTYFHPEVEIKDKHFTSVIVSVKHILEEKNSNKK